MARSLWEDATPEARAGLRDIQQHVGATPGKRTGPGSPGYMAPRNEAPKRQASIGRRLEAKTKMDIARMDREATASRQQAAYDQADKVFERNLASGNFGGSTSGGTAGKRKLEDPWKYGGKSDLTESPTYRTNASGMQLYIPESTDEETGVTTPGHFGETIGGSGNLDAPNVPNKFDSMEDYRDYKARSGGLQNIYQRKEKRPDGSDRYAFTQIGTPNIDNGDRVLANKSGSGYDREMMHLSWRDGAEDKRIAKAAAMEKAGAGKPSVATDVPIAETTAIPTNETPTIPSDSLRDAPGMAHVSGQFEDTPLYKGGVQAGKGLKNLAADFVAQYDTPKRDKVIPQLVDQGQTAPIDPRLRRKSTFLENKQFEDISTKFKDRYQLINGRWVDTQAVK
jgi:hypothetical protein